MVHNVSLCGFIVPVRPEVLDRHIQGLGNCLLYPAGLALAGQDDIYGCGADSEFLRYIHALDVIEDHQGFYFAIH